ncbi:MAG: hypothetical protein ACI9RM_002832 [Ulvibacter sp.]
MTITTSMVSGLSAISVSSRSTSRGNTSSSLYRGITMEI